MKVFVVIWRDRHSDDSISVHATRESADRKVEYGKAIYKDHEWTERDYGRPIGWVRYVESYDGGPWFRIEETDLIP